MAVETPTGQLSLWDLPSEKPLLVKYHQCGLPIKSVGFQDSLDLILSADFRIIKTWNKNSGKILTSLEPEPDSKDKNHMIISIDAEKAFDKVQHRFMIKNT